MFFPEIDNLSLSTLKKKKRAKKTKRKTNPKFSTEITTNYFIGNMVCVSHYAWTNIIVTKLSFGYTNHLLVFQFPMESLGFHRTMEQYSIEQQGKNSNEIKKH